MSLKNAIAQELESLQGAQGKAKSISGKYNAPNSQDGLQALLIRNKLDALFSLRDHKDEVRAGLHASSIIASDNKFCYRQAVLSLLYKQDQGEQFLAKQLRIFAAGNSIHEKWQQLFIKGGIAVEIEKRHFSEQYELYFTPDAVVMLDGLKWVVEIKSMNTFSYSKANSHPSGQKQLRLYEHLLGIPRGFVLAEDKNTQDWKPFITDYDAEAIAPTLGRLNEVQELKRIFLKTGEMPPKICKDCNTTQSRECNMRSACFNIGIGRIRL